MGEGCVKEMSEREYAMMMQSPLILKAGTRISASCIRSNHIHADNKKE